MRKIFLFKAKIIKFIVFIFILIFLVNCTTSDSDLLKWVKIKFSYFRIKSFIALGLQIHNTSNKILWNPGYGLDFLLNDKKNMPLFEINKYWLGKHMLPGSPKGRYEYMTVLSLANMLDTGLHKMKWKYGPIYSNEIILEVNKDKTIKEIKVECENYVKKLGISAYKNRIKSNNQE